MTVCAFENNDLRERELIWVNLKMKFMLFF